MERTVTTGIEILPSYVRDAWWSPAPDAPAVTVRDASTGEDVARLSTDGLDLAGALEHARTAGQRSLGTLSFHERAQAALADCARVLEGSGEVEPVGAEAGDRLTRRGIPHRDDSYGR